MTRRECGGSVLVLASVAVSALFLFCLLVVSIARIQIEAARAKAGAEISVLGALRMRDEALGAMAERWSTMASVLGPVDAGGRVFLTSASVATLTAQARTLSRALPGYQARTSSVVTVLAQANARDRDRIHIDNDAGSRLGVVAQPALVISETGVAQPISTLWYQRLWSPGEERSDPGGVVRHRIEFDTDLGVATVRACGQLRWNRTPDGNGGYPRAWSSALKNGRLIPNRTASYRAVLVDGGS